MLRPAWRDALLPWISCAALAPWARSRKLRRQMQCQRRRCHPPRRARVQKASTVSRVRCATCSASDLAGRSAMLPLAPASSSMFRTTKHANGQAARVPSFSKPSKPSRSIVRSMPPFLPRQVCQTALTLTWHRLPFARPIWPRWPRARPSQCHRALLVTCSRRRDRNDRKRGAHRMLPRSSYSRRPTAEAL